jgi:hypothetical protein
MAREYGELASTSKNMFGDPIIDLATCRLLSQGAEAVSVLQNLSFSDCFPISVALPLCEV